MDADDAEIQDFMAAFDANEEEIKVQQAQDRASPLASTLCYTL